MTSSSNKSGVISINIYMFTKEMPAVCPSGILFNIFYGCLLVTNVLITMDKVRWGLGGGGIADQYFW